MGFLKRIFGKARGGAIPMGNVQGLIRIASSDDYERAERAIIALGGMPFSDEIFNCLYHFTSAAISGAGPHSSAAIAALGLLGHPRAAKRLVQIVASGSLSWKEAAESLSHPRNHSAVPELLKIALTHRNYICVEAAVNALAAIGTPEARSAVEQFYNQPARELSILYTGFETSEKISSSALGQLPTEEELQIARAKLAAENLFRFGTREDMRAALALCLSKPEAAPLRDLKVFLEENDFVAAQKVVDRILSTHYGDLNITRAALAPWVKASHDDADARKKDVQHLLSSGDTTKLESHLLKQLESQFDHQWAFGLLELLPRIRQITKLADVVRSGRFEERVLLYVFKVIWRHAPEQLPPLIVAFLKEHPGSVVSAEAVNLLQGCGEEVLPLVLPLLKGKRWAARMRAVEFLGLIRAEAARKALETQLTIEQDYEIRRAIEASLKYQGA